MALQSFKPLFDPKQHYPESDQTRALIEALRLEPHPEGGYFVVTDYNDTFRVPNPFLPSGKPSGAGTPTTIQSYGLSTNRVVSSRAASTTIYYYLSPQRSLGVLHRNRARTVHTLHRGRGRYVIIHADEVATGDSYPGPSSPDVSESSFWTGSARVESFVVGPNILEGEKLQWIVEGGKYKSSWLLPDEESGETSDGLLISETVIPGFEWEDHDFMKMERPEELVSKEQRDQMEWMVKKWE